MFLTCSHLRCIFPSISSQPEGALPGTLWNVGVGAAPEGGGSCSRTREVLGIRPGPLRGLPSSGWTGTGEGWEIAVSAKPAPEERGPGPEIAATERREALPCASVSRRSGKQAAAVTKVRLSAFRLPLFFRGRFTEPTIHVKGFAGGDDACPEEGASDACQHLSVVLAHAGTHNPGGHDCSEAVQQVTSANQNIGDTAYGSPPSQGRRHDMVGRNRQTRRAI